MREAAAPTVAQPLRGISVIEDGDDLALAFCGKYLAALGADVHVLASNHLADHTRWVREYVDDGKIVGAADGPCDVILTAFPDRIAPEGALRVLVTDNGTSGPQANWTSGELLAQASSGLTHLIGEPGGPPLQLGGHQIDYSTGLMAFTAVMIALTARTLHPEDAVQDIQLSRLEAAAYIEWKGRVYSQVDNELQRGERSGPMVIRCKDGFFGMYYRPMDWPAVVSALGAPELHHPPFDTQAGRIAHRSDLTRLLNSLCGEMSSDDLYLRLQQAGVPAGPVMDAGGLSESRQYTHRHFLVANPLTGVGALQPAIPVEFNGQRPKRDDAP